MRTSIFVALLTLSLIFSLFFFLSLSLVEFSWDYSISDLDVLQPSDDAKNALIFGGHFPEPTQVLCGLRGSQSIPALSVHRCQHCAALFFTDAECCSVAVAPLIS